jgi:hypothetical protein
MIKNKINLPDCRIILKIMTFILGIGLGCVLILIHPIKYWNPDKGEFGTRRIPFYKVLGDNPNQIIIFLVIILFIAILAICIRFIRRQK